MAEAVVFLLRKMVLHALFSGIAIGSVFALSPKVFAGDTDTARNYLSTIVSCLSTIFTLCISITLVAIQLTSSRYTHRVLDLFLKMPFNISLTLFYFVTIFQSLFLLSCITEPIHETLPAYLQPQMNADMVLVILCFIMLIAYLYAVTRLLKPERIVSEIEREYRAAIRRSRRAEALSKVEQICDIAKRAAADLDSTTGAIAVEALGKMANDGTQCMRSSVIRQFVEIAAIAAKEREGGMLAVVLQGLQKIGEEAVREGRQEDAYDVLSAFERVVQTGLIGQQLFHFVDRAVTAIYQLVRIAVRVELGENLTIQSGYRRRTFATLESIGEAILAQEKGGTTYVARVMLAQTFADALRIIGESAQGTPPEGQWRLLILYITLARRFMIHAELQDVRFITTWLRRQSRHSAIKQPHIQSAALTLAILLPALARHMGRNDIERYILRALAEQSDFPYAQRSALIDKLHSLRPIFDFDDPAPLLDQVCLTWQTIRCNCS